MIELPNARPHNASWQSRVFRPFAEIAVAVYVVLDSLFRTLFRPISRWLAKLALIIRLEAIIGNLPPYAVLGLMVLPFAVAEPAKIFAIYWMSTGHILAGFCLLIAAYFVSVLVVDRMFHAGKAKLLTIPWFARLWTWISNYKDRMIGWMKSTDVWKRTAEMKQQLRTWVLQFR